MAALVTGALLALFATRNFWMPSEEGSPGTEAFVATPRDAEMLPAQPLEPSASLQGEPRQQRDVESGAMGPRRAFKIPPASPVSGSALEKYRELSERANRGDAEAAYELFGVLSECFHKAAGGGDYRSTIDCSGIDTAHYNEMAKLVRLAAEAGNVKAQLNYSIVGELAYATPKDIASDLEGFKRYREDSMRFLGNAARAGSVDAMLALSDAYAQGFLVEQDPVASYAYLNAALQTGLLVGGSATSERMSAALNVDELRRANEQARRILQACCGR